MPVFEAPAVYVQSSVITLATYFIQHAYLKEMIDFHSTDANFIPLSCPTKAVYIRRDNDRKQTHVNVFDDKGKKIYVIQRESPLNPVWSMLQLPSRKEVATIRAGFFTKAVDFHNKAGLRHREINNESGFSGRLRTFYLDDGHKYAWTRGSKFLEKFTNPGGQDEEVRERVAKVRLMRQWKFDFELVLDENKVDLESALATAFVSMMTFWGYGDITETVGPTKIPEPMVKLPSPIEATANRDKQQTPNVTLVVNCDNDADLIIERA
ncbi:hypothetical protein CANARDRAFT_177222 [[Candida] arabinofermentans NRRL YB-2248]|uniref:Uncharacterized protein n=1 Tax=[Candida] arabinofermentans NRRL YB-2248 TaxID=983967 RepID=A0A1E4SX76_9ASCO|nr:hypothetical protein CANARDRAFT_177222 [[Candida] arabinofermentans NRRL YB-2248]